MDLFIGPYNSDFQPPASEQLAIAIPSSSRNKGKSRACVVPEDKCGPEVGSRGLKATTSRLAEFQRPESEQSDKAIPKSSRKKGKSRARVVTEDECGAELVSRGSKSTSSKLGRNCKEVASVLNEEKSNRSHSASPEIMEDYQPGVQTAKMGMLMLTSQMSSNR